MIYLKLFLDFFRVSCFTFGGAYGAIPLIREMVLENRWLAEGELTHMIAVSESTPGPIMVNLATYIGSDQAGFAGALIATFAVVLPAYLVIVLVTGILKNAIKNKYVRAVLGGLSPCVVGVVTATGLWMSIRACTVPFVDYRAMVITVLLGALLIFYPMITKKKLSPISLILISALLGILIY